MSDVFISYKREDQPRAAAIAQALQAAGLDVWWDQHLESGETWRQRIAQELDAARCVVALWSKASTGPDAHFVLDEANRAMRRGTLQPVFIDDVEPPLGFGEIQALDLRTWNGDPADASVTRVVDAVRKRLGAAEGSAQPVYSTSRNWRKWLPWGAVAGALLAVAGVVANVSAVVEVARDLWGIARPDPRDQAFWSKRRPGNCDDLAVYLTSYPKGAHAAEAQALLARKKSVHGYATTAEERRLPLTVRTAENPFPGRQAARADALARAKQDAADACSGFSQGEFRLVSAEASVREWRCRQRPGGYACGFDGLAICRVQKRLTRDVCQ